MNYNPQNPLIVQGDRSVLLEVGNEYYAAARDVLARFAELEKSPEFVHTYRITPLSLWNAAASGLDAETILPGLERYSKYPIPDHVGVEIRDSIGRYGRVKLLRDGDSLLMRSDDETVMVELARHREVAPYILEQVDANTARVDLALRGHIKQALVNIGYPAEDLAGYVEGEALTLILRDQTLSGDSFHVRDYPREAASIFYADGAAQGGSGVIEPIHAVLNLHLRGRLMRIAEEGKSGLWHLTAQSVKQAGGSQKKVTVLLDELARLNRGALSTALVNQVKAWGGYYGTARSETLTLIEFQNQSILEELLGLPTLSSMLTPFARDGRALAIVESGTLSEVKKLLRELGVSVKKGITG